MNRYRNARFGTLALLMLMLIETPGGDHFVANDPMNQSGMIGRYGLAWLKVFLEGDDRYRAFLLEMPANATTDFRSNVE